MVLAEARDRLERGRLGARSMIAIELAPAERRQVGQLLAASWAPSGAAVSVAALRRGLGVHGVTLEGLLVTLSGPLRDRQAERRETARLADVETTAATQDLLALLDLHPSSKHWAAAQTALQWWVLRQAQPRDRAAEVRAVVAALRSSDDAVLLPVLAAAVTRDAHALDRTRSLGRAVARFLAVRSAFAVENAVDPMINWKDPAESIEGWRTAWAAGGVACDTVSSQVLTLNLRLSGDAAAVRLCRAVAGEPVWLTLRSLTGSLAHEPGTDVFVCENPSVLESAADRLGPASAPLICTFGRPGLAAVRLLRAVAETATVHVRADGDRAGHSIVATLQAAVPSVRLWLMSADTTAYEEELLDELIADLSRDAANR